MWVCVCVVILDFKLRVILAKMLSYVLERHFTNSIPHAGFIRSV